MKSHNRQLKIDELNANHYMVSVHKYGFFLCLKGNARILLGSNIYQISKNHLCIYAPNTFFQILEKSSDLSGILDEDDVKTYYPVISPIDIRKRLQMRNSPCVIISEEQSDEITRIYNVIQDNYNTSIDDKYRNNQSDLSQIAREDCRLYLRYALCLKVLEVYFSNTPLDAVPQTKEDEILNLFLVSLYDNCHKQRLVQFYADEQHLSPYYFSTIIRNRSGQSALQWICNVTMTFSKQYLECTDMSIKEIADKLSFPDQSTFGRYFKRNEGCSPLEYRIKIAKLTN